MKTPSLPERIETLEHEVRGLESTIDAQTRRLWTRIEELQAEVMRLRGQKVETPEKNRARA